MGFYYVSHRQCATNTSHCLRLIIPHIHNWPWSYIQMAALSPADINYAETMSTLRFGKCSLRGYGNSAFLIIHTRTYPGKLCIYHFRNSVRE